MATRCCSSTADRWSDVKQIHWSQMNFQGISSGRESWPLLQLKMYYKSPKKNWKNWAIAPLVRFLFCLLLFLFVCVFLGLGISLFEWKISYGDVPDVCVSISRNSDSDGPSPSLTVMCNWTSFSKTCQNTEISVIILFFQVSCKWIVGRGVLKKYLLWGSQLWIKILFF